MSLKQIIYMSTLRLESLPQLPAILASAVRNNKANGLTGMLLYAGGNFVQVLEGEEPALHATFQKIENDPRHFDVFVLIDGPIEARQFTAWSMGYRELNESDLKEFPAAAHIFKCRPDEIALRVRPGDALAVLQSFAPGLMGIR